MSLTDSHHHHRGEIPTMVGICHGWNMPLGHDDDDDNDDGNKLTLTRVIRLYSADPPVPYSHGVV